MRTIKDTEIIETLRMADQKLKKLFSTIETGTAYSDMGSDTDFVFKCAFDKKQAIWDYCSEELFKLAQISDTIRERIMHIMETGNAHEKFIITVSTMSKWLYPLNESFMEFRRKILYLAITDKSKKVKRFGVTRTVSLRLYDLAPTIKDESEKINDPELKRVFEECYIYLTKGYILKEGYSLKIGGTQEPALFAHIAFSSYQIPSEIPKDKIHEYIITRFKDFEYIIRDLYCSD